MIDGIGMEHWSGNITAASTSLMFLSLIVYAIQVRKWIKRLPQKSIAEASTTSSHALITAVIPCRNESKRIPLLLEDLAMQQMPVKVIVIDDHSTDGTRKAVEDRGIECLTNEGNGKKSALRLAHSRVKTPWMATLDADVRVGKGWSESMVRTIREANAEQKSEIRAILGTVRIDAHQKSAWERFQAIEYGCLMVWIEGGVHAQNLAMGSGANSLYRTQSYPAMELREDQASGDDAYALKAIKRDQGRILWNSNSSGLADTEPVAEWSHLWNQRARWASKTNDGSDRETQVVGLVVTAIHLSFIMTSICIIFSGASAAIGLLVGIALKTQIDQPLISSAARRYELKVTPSDRFWFSWRYAGLVWGAWWHLFRGQVHWKGRRL